MALAVGTNSWVTVAEADAYFLEKFGASAWAALPNATKEQLLISAYRWIQSQTMFTIAASSTLAIVKQAQYEAAWYMYKYWDQHEDRRALVAQGVTDFKISQFEETLSESKFPKFITDMLDDFITGGGFSFPVVTRTFEQ